MVKKVVIGSVYGAVILGIVAGLVFSIKTSLPTQTKDTVSMISEESMLKDISPTASKEETAGVSFPTIPPLYSKVQTIDVLYVYITGKSGTVRLTKNKVKIFRRSGDQLIPVTLDKLKVGQNVTIKPIVSGEETHLIIEE